MKQMLKEYKWGISVISLLLISLFAYLMTSFGIDSDTWFILHNGEYILNNGFPHTNPFTIHKDLPFIITSWLTSVLEYLIYQWLGSAGLFIWLIIGSIILIISFYYFIQLFSENKKIYISLSLAIISTLLLNAFISNRPTLFTMSIVIIEIICLELYKRTNKKMYCFLIIGLGCLLMQLHASIFIVFYLPILAYFGEEIFLFLKNVYIQKQVKIAIQTYDFKMLFSYILLILGGTFVAIINPYGISSLLFLFTSYNNCYGKNINFISELYSPEFLSVESFHCLFMILIGICYIQKHIKYKDLEIKYIFLWAGGIILLPIAIRNYWMFYIFTLPLLIKHISSYPETCDLVFERFKQLLKNKKYLCLLTGAYIITFILGYIHVSNWFNNPIQDSEITPVQAVEYLQKNEDTNNLKIFNSFNNGGYLGFKGYPVYIDARPELYSYNQGYQNQSIYTEYIQLITNQSHDIDGFLQYYDFDYLIVPNFTNTGMSSVLQYYLKESVNYELVVTGNQYMMYKSIK